jgi:serine protease DegQ
MHLRRHRPVVLAALLLFAASAPIAGPAQAALPADVDGQPLPSLAPMLERVTPAVVNVHSRSVVRVRNPLADDPFFRHFFGMPALPQQRVQQSLGSGVVVDALNGLVLTNNHVIEGASDISVTLADGRSVSAEFVGADPDTDVALIRIPTDGLHALPLADSERLRVGDFVVAVGNPFGLGQTVTSGIVSALGRSGLQGVGYQNFIQTDASINPGNSGGALVNLRGELVGINTAIFSPSGGNVGIGFAIPASLASEVMGQLLAFGEVRRGSLGVQAQDITPQLAELLKLDRRHGAVVARVLPGTPAERAGLQVGDTIIALGGQPIRSRQALHNLEGLLPVDKPTEIQIVRNGDERTLRATLQARPTSLRGAVLDPRLAGAVFAELPDQLRRRGLSGVRIGEVEAGSRAAANGLRPGDVVAAVNRREVSDLSALQQMLSKPPKALLLTVLRSGGAFLVQVE